MPDSPDKVAERWWAKFLFGVRVPSQGVSNEDLSGKWFTGEHKYRKLEQYSAEFRKAIQQYDANREREKVGKKRFPLIAFTFHGSRGQNARRFLMIEVFPSDKDIKNLLKEILVKIETSENVST